MARKTGYLETILPDIADTPNFQAMLRVDESTVSGIRSLYGLFKVLKCNHQHGHFCHFVYIEYYSAGDIFTKFEKFYPLARFASSRCSELSAAFGDLRACYRGRVRITVALASAVIYI